ncbi:MAG TPA: trehalase family glycosidase [Anaerolineales bacterium]|nr:trehalase family glycosidase [Anaerolineales bacterium]
MNNDSPFLANSRLFTDCYDTHISNPWVEENRFLSLQPSRNDLPSFSKAREILPDPFWADHMASVACYWRAWELAFSNLKQPVPENDFVANYCDTAFNGNLFMWDSAFITCFGSYGRRAFDFQQTLDNFYRKQHKDGFICREISEVDGRDCFQRFDPSSTGPSVLAWAEWNYYLQTADDRRLAMVFPALVAYHQWLRTYRTWQDGSYWSTGWGSGMDNLPRVKKGHHIDWGHGHMTWVDATFQAILSGKILLRTAALLEREVDVRDIQEEVARLGEYANQYLWNEKLNFYCDRFAEGELSPMKHIGAYWSLLARCIAETRIPRLVAHLENPNEFNRLHRVPALSADDPNYSGTGGYWCGGVWAPTNYMVLKGLDAIGRNDLGHEIAKNHLENVVRVFEAEDTHWAGAEQFRQYFHLAELKYDDKHTLWENYAPDAIEPGGHSKPGYVGWTGLPPIAVLLEDVFGIVPDATANQITWNIRLLEEHGVRRYPFGLNGLLDLKCSRRDSQSDRPLIETHSNIPLTLKVVWEGGTETVNIENIS